MGGTNPGSENNFIVKAIVLFSLATIAFYLLTEHKAHLLAYSSYIIFFVFILMHLFMHSGHGGHGGHGQGKHKHEEVKQKGNEQGAGEHQNTGQHEHSQEENKL